MSKRRWLLGCAGVLLFVTTSGALVGACLFDGPRWAGPATDHFDGEKFRTPGALDVGDRGPADILKWQMNRQQGPWGAYRDVPPGPPPPAKVDAPLLRATFVNHATILVQLDGVNVLTDPIYAERASPVQWAGPRRVRPPGIRFEDLPEIHASVISHNHYDHLDMETLKRLQIRFPAMSVFVGLGNKALLERDGLKNVVELDWWQESVVQGLRIQSVPNQHFSRRGLTDGNGTLWTGFVLHGQGGPVYFGGDTGYGPHFKEVGDKLGPMRLAILPIGAYKPEWFMGPIHGTPAQAVQAANDLRATVGLGMHFGTFPMADDGEVEPLEDLKAALDKAPREFWVLGFGEGRDVPATADSTEAAPK